MLQFNCLSEEEDPSYGGGGGEWENLFGHILLTVQS